jgi:signal peptidase I
MRLRLALTAALFLSTALAGCSTHLAHSYRVLNGGMRPTLDLDDHIRVIKTKPVRGSIVLFHPYEWQVPDPKSDYVKRVIGIGGDRITCSTGQALLVNGQPLPEPYLVRGESACQEAIQITVPLGYYWLLGDHRAGSADSRFYGNDGHAGAIAAAHVYGVVSAIVAPASRARQFR